MRWNLEWAWFGLTAPAAAANKVILEKLTRGSAKPSGQMSEPSGDVGGLQESAEPKGIDATNVDDGLLAKTAVLYYDLLVELGRRALEKAP